MKIDFRRVKDLLQVFDFQKVFVEELGWSNPSRGLRESSFTAAGTELTRRPIAELSGFVVFEVSAAGGAVPDSKARAAAHRIIGAHHHEHVLIFVDRARQKSVWSWVHRREGRDQMRTHHYFQGQPGDLFIGKLGAMMFDLGDFDEEGNTSVVEVARRVRAALDVEAVTQRFFDDFQKQHMAFLGLVRGIADDRRRRWYVSVLLNRLMFIHFIQKKGFLDGGNFDYLQERLAWSRRELGADRYYKDFLKLFFFEGFAKPEEERSPQARERLGRVRYLNGGLFLPHRVEIDNPGIDVPDSAFEDLFALFGRYTWHLDDTPGGDDHEINPDVLGYIFEKYINQKSFGAYYTRPEITSWLCEQTIHRLVLDGVNPPKGTEFNLSGGAPARFDDVSDLLLHLTPALCRRLLDDVLPSLALLDPACGSGAFLVAALKTMLGIYGAVVGAAKTLPDESMKAQIEQWEHEHASLGYFLKKRIITNNLYGVDLMEEATEIARLRLFLALVASASREEDLEPLPNIDFNIMPGNSLIGLLRVKDEKFNRHGRVNLFAPTCRQLVDEKNRLVRSYRDATVYGEDLARLRDDIEEKKNKARSRLDEILYDDFRELGIRFEQPTWDDRKNDVGKSKKRSLRIDDISGLRPFHWDYEFDDVMRRKGGFDAILANPPWEVFEPDDRHFVSEQLDIGLMRNMAPEQFHKKRAEFLSVAENRAAYIDYLARYPLPSAWFRMAPEYEHQRATVDGRRLPPRLRLGWRSAAGKLNLYKLFVERCYRLLRDKGQFGLVLQSGIYNDLGAKALREMLFRDCELRSLYGFSNERFLFEGVDHRFKICILVGQKGGPTTEFEAAFRIDPREAVDIDHITEFLRDRARHVMLTPELIAATSPDSLSITEFHDRADVELCKRLMTVPALGRELDDAWNLKLAQGDINLTSDRNLYEPVARKDYPALYEGKMIHQFEPYFAEPRYWVRWRDAQSVLHAARLRRAKDAIKAKGASLIDDEPLQVRLDSDAYRLAFREVARNTDGRSMICTILPPGVVAAHTLVLHRPWRDVVKKRRHLELSSLSARELLYVVGVFNSFVADWFLRQRISAHVSIFYVRQLPVPRLADGDSRLVPIAGRVAKLICTTPAFDDLAKAAGLGSHKKGVTQPEARAKLRAELDGLVAHLYGLTEEEFAHVLNTFPVVPEPVREAARNAWRAVRRGEIE